MDGLVGRTLFSLGLDALSQWMQAASPRAAPLSLFELVQTCSGRLCYASVPSPIPNKGEVGSINKKSRVRVKPKTCSVRIRVPA